MSLRPMRNWVYYFFANCTVAAIAALTAWQGVPVLVVFVSAFVGVVLTNVAIWWSLRVFSGCESGTTRKTRKVLWIGTALIGLGIIEASIPFLGAPTSADRLTNLSAGTFACLFGGFLVIWSQKTAK